MRIFFKNGFENFFIAMVFGVLLQCLSVNSFAVEAESQAPADTVAMPLTAHQTVELTTDKMLTLIQAAKEYFDEDESRFYLELREILSPFIDFDSFAREVMGVYADKAHMETLAPEEQEVLLAKIKQFSAVFSEGLIQFYGKGLLAFEGERIEVVPPKKEAQNATRATVKQLVYGKGDDPFVVLYAMRKNAQQEWKLRNVMVNRVDVGKTYRNQFYNAMKVSNKDIDQVIANWSVVPGQ